MATLIDLTKATIQRNVPLLLLFLIVGFMGTGCGGGNNAGNGASASTDTTPPSIPESINAQAVSSMQIDLSWSASTDAVGVTGYNIYRCTGSSCTPTVLLSTVNSLRTSYSDTGLTAETTYAYAVMAYDAVSNVSNKTSSVRATTNATTSSGNSTIFSVSGTLGDGGNVVIGGSGFGSVGPNVIVFDDFESGVAGADINTGLGSAKYGQWDLVSSVGSTYYGITASVSGSQSFTSDYSVSYANWIQADLPASTRNVFISWWLYVPASSNWPGEGNTYGINWKQTWLQGSSTNNDDIYIPARLNSGWLFGGNENDPGYINYTSINMVKGEWKRVWVWLKGSTSSTSNDGEVKFWELINTGVVQRENDIGINNLKATGSWERIRPNGYGRQTSNCMTSFDDIYIASGPNAQARVEIGDNSIYTNSTKLSILTPTAWSDTLINATLNQGSFNSGDTAYLFVVDAGGTASEGYPITIQ